MEFKRCYGCMRELPAPGAVCPHCGYDNTNDPIDPRKQPSCMLPCGTVLNGKYVTGRVLGQGGFGITYIGFEMNLEKPVCIKEYFPAGVAMRASTQSRLVLWSGGNTESMRQGRESFVREAQQAAKLERLSHVVNVTEVFYENETAYIVMEYIEGETLKQRLVQTKSTLRERECVELLSPVMEDLEKAHGMGIIHRDIKPDNIMLRKDGEPVLLDMGAAKDLIKAEKDGTLSSTAVVSEGFSPLEQYSKKNKTGPYSDVYSMCATIYYCVTGKVPSSSTERVVEDDLDLSGFTAPFASVLDKGLAVKAHDRIQTMGELLTALGGDKRERDYQSAKALMDRGDESSLWAARSMFKSLGDYRDAAAHAEDCKKRLEETEENRMEETRRNELRRQEEARHKQGEEAGKKEQRGTEYIQKTESQDFAKEEKQEETDSDDKTIGKKKRRLVWPAPKLIVVLGVIALYAILYYLEEYGILKKQLLNTVAHALGLRATYWDYSMIDFWPLLYGISLLLLGLVGIRYIFRKNNSLEKPMLCKTLILLPSIIEIILGGIIPYKVYTGVYPYSNTYTQVYSIYDVIPFSISFLCPVIDGITAFISLKYEINYTKTQKKWAVFCSLMLIVVGIVFAVVVYNQ